MLSRIVNNISCCNLENEDMLKEVTVKIELERINIQEILIAEALLDSKTTVLVMSSEFTRKKELRLKKMEKPIYVRNMNGSFNKKGPIEHIVEVNIYYQGHRETMEIDIIGEQKWSVILEMLWLAYHNPEID